METNTIVYFYEGETQKKQFFCTKSMCKVESLNWKERTILMIGIPKSLNKEKQLRKQLMPKLMDRKREFAFFYNPTVEEKLPLLQTLLPIEKLPIVPEDIRDLLLQEHGQFDALIILDGRYLDSRDFIVKWIRKLNFLAIITEAPERYTEFFEDLYEEYGLPAITALRLEEVHPIEKLKVLVVDAREEVDKSFRALPANAILS